LEQVIIDRDVIVILKGKQLTVSRALRVRDPGNFSMKE
jgi:hypothetical protein